MKESGMGHFLQSREWQKFEEKEGRRTFWQEGEGWRYMAVRREMPLGAYLYTPYGPVADKAHFAAALDSLLCLAREQDCLFVRIEPTMPVVDKMDKVKDNDDVITVDEMRGLGCVKVHDVQPAHTWVIDLAGTQEELLARLERRRTRYWKNLEKKGARIRTSQDPGEIGILTRLLEKLGSERKFTPQNEKHLKLQLEAGFATLYIMEVQEEQGWKPIAAALVHDWGETRYYVHAAADEAYARLRPAIVVTVQAMVDAQAAGKKWFDFWGVTTSEDPKHPWYGFTQYKKSFQGQQVDYGGAWDRPIKKWRYRVYRVLRKVLR